MTTPKLVRTQSSATIPHHRRLRFRLRRPHRPPRSHRSLSPGPLRLPRRYRPSPLRLQVPPHHCPLRRPERAVPGPRAGRRIPRHRLQHRQRPRPRRHSGSSPGPRPRRHRARRIRRPRRLQNRRRPGHRHRRHRPKPRLLRRLPGAGTARAGDGLPAACSPGRRRLDRSPQSPPR